MKFRGGKEKEVFELLKERWPTDEILHQYKFNFRHSYKRPRIEYYKVTKKRWGKRTYIHTMKYKSLTVDFLNITKNIAIEVDGPSHQGSRFQDKARDNALKRKGFKVIRIPYDVGFIEGTKKLLNENQDT